MYVPVKKQSLGFDPLKHDIAGMDGIYWIRGRSVFFTVNSSDSKTSDLSGLQCIMQLPPVCSKETGKAPAGKVEDLTDMGNGGKAEDSPFPVCLLIVRVQLFSESLEGKTVYSPAGTSIPLIVIRLALVISLKILVRSEEEMTVIVSPPDNLHCACVGRFGS